MRVHHTFEVTTYGASEVVLQWVRTRWVVVTTLCCGNLILAFLRLKCLADNFRSLPYNLKCIIEVKKLLEPEFLITLAMPKMDGGTMRSYSQQETAMTGIPARDLNPDSYGYKVQPSTRWAPLLSQSKVLSWSEYTQVGDMKKTAIIASLHWPSGFICQLCIDLLYLLEATNPREWSIPFTFIHIMTSHDSSVE